MLPPIEVLDGKIYTYDSRGRWEIVPVVENDKIVGLIAKADATAEELVR